MSEKPNITKTQTKEAKRSDNNFRKNVKSAMDEIFKECEDLPKSASFSKNIEISESDVTLLHKRVDALKKVFDVAEESCSSSGASKIQKLIDKTILIALKYEYSKEDSDVVIRALKKEVSTLKGEVAKLKKQETGSKREFDFS
ncbi:hypothetical protein VCHA53O466_40347 [Vibrio chagasii]|nr:hypothetical protein VCHA53O466_40347 [Vibrio chagasii]